MRRADEYAERAVEHSAGEKSGSEIAKAQVFALLAIAAAIDETASRPFVADGEGGWYRP